MTIYVPYASMGQKPFAHYKRIALPIELAVFFA